MNDLTKFMLFCSLPLAVAFGQEQGAPTNAPSPSLQLSKSRSQSKRIEFLLQVAQAYAKEGDLKAAIDAYERILEIEPEHPQARYLVSHTYIQVKQYQKAEKMLLALIEERPNDFSLLNNLAWVYATAEDPAIRDGQKAIKYAQQAIVVSPNDHHVWSTLSEAYYVSGDYEKAHRAIMHMASLATRYGKGITKEAVEDYNEQIKKCKRAMDTAEVMKDIDKASIPSPDE